MGKNVHYEKYIFILRLLKKKLLKFNKNALSARTDKTRKKNLNQQIINTVWIYCAFLIIQFHNCITYLGDA